MNVSVFKQPFPSDHRPFEHLNALFFPFDHFHVHANGISDFKTGRRLLPEGLLYPFQPIHETTPPPHIEQASPARLHE